MNELGSIQAVGHMLQADQMDQRTTRCRDRGSDERPVRFVRRDWPGGLLHEPG